MHISSLRTYHFRNLSDQVVEFAPGINFISGRNGHGKTNLLEAISLLSHTKSFRTSDSADLVKAGERAASVFGHVQRDNGDEIDLGIAIEDGAKSAYLGPDKCRTLPEFIGKLACITFTPDDLDLVKAGPAGRRKFLDRHIVDLNPQIIEHLVTLSRAFKHKSALLRDEHLDMSTLAEKLEAWNTIIATAALEVETARRALVQGLSERVAHLYGMFGATGEALELALESELPADLSIESVHSYLNANMQREIAQRRNIAGPQRDDLAISLAGRDARTFASQGQARSIVLVLKLAVLDLLSSKLGEQPVLLLDDVDSELDHGRLNILYGMILNRPGCQVIATGTEPSPFVRERSDVRLIQVQGGVVAGADPSSI